MMTARQSGVQRLGFRSVAFTALGVVAMILGILSTGWLIGMADQWLIPWQSMAVLTPPR